MIQEVKILQVSTRRYMLINHFGILINEAGEEVVYHNDQDPFNRYGGNILRESLASFLDGRTLEGIKITSIDLSNLYAYIEENKAKKYNALTYNCEHFITEAIMGKKLSPQVIFYSLTTGVLSFFGLKYLIKKYKFFS